jgi:hypothetical protein
MLQGCSCLFPLGHAAVEHVVHAVCPELLAKLVPALQEEQLDDCGEAENDPGRQGLHSENPVNEFEYVPG